MELSNESEIVQKGKISYPKDQSAYLSKRGMPEKKKASYPNEQSAFEAKRGIPEKGKVTYKDSRYK